MANQLVNPVSVAQCLMVAASEVVRNAGEMVLDDQFAIYGTGLGYVINYRLPSSFGRDMFTLTDTIVPISINLRSEAKMDISDQELTLTIGELSRRYLEPHGRELGRMILRQWPLGHVLACVKGELPGGMEWSESIVHPGAKLALRLVRGYDMRCNNKFTVADVLYGTASPDAAPSSPLMLESPRLKELLRLKAEIEAQRKALGAKPR